MSNIAMIVIPVIAFFFIEIIMGYLLFVAFNGDTEGEHFELYLRLRFIGMLVVLVITNGLLTYFVARSIIKPIQQLSEAANKISEGNLNFELTVKGKDEISQLARMFETMRKKLKQTEELNQQYENNRKELITSISHDLKTPITSIKGYVDGIRDGVANTPEKMEKYMDTIYSKANTLDHMIEELFIYSKLDLKKVPFHFENMDLRSYLEDFMEELRFDMEDKGGSVHFHVEEDKKYIIKADRDKINRVITNIIENSLKYMNKDRPEINIFLKSEQNFVKVQIKDNGSGIDQQSISRIFEQFYRTDNSRNSSTGGSGIGLAIVKQIMEGHNGEVWAESEEGIGTSVFFTLPKAGENE